MATKTINSLKRPSPGGSSRPSPAPSQSLPLAPGQIHSQVADTGTGSELLTQVNYASSHLKSKPRGTQLSFEDLLSYLSLQHADEQRKHMLLMALKMNPSIRYDPKALDGRGGFAFKPKYDISNSAQLLQRLQSQRTFHGFPAKGLEEGWPDYKEEINELNDQHKVLVLAAKKDQAPRTIWSDDPSLWHDIDVEFKDMWSKIKLPDAENTANELEKHNLLPTNKFKKAKLAVTTTTKKPKKSKRSGKITNHHMQDILKDYSHKRK
ncbi:MAG: hypothetical protein GOMPHAMPRED_003589 [Gomphillus americanus]|uniref:Transcription initiation factor IIE subunit beta n=1 Tax=Gomphillus americanus TaxID=1940652 RepID=A0A8H3ISE1_9LECA|nr:MAG: hypothetical protein GOMPHAMPRED_003589 [Gomphillus americanus]